jgi:predicted RNase H-like HicB family nuclease
MPAGKRRGSVANEFTAVFERDGEWYIGYCPEIPGANGQGKTKDEARASLADVIALILEDRRQDALRGIPPGAELETVTIKRKEAPCSSTCASTAAISSAKVVATRCSVTLKKKQAEAYTGRSRRGLGI